MQLHFTMRTFSLHRWLALALLCGTLPIYPHPQPADPPKSAVTAPTETLPPSDPPAAPAAIAPPVVSDAVPAPAVAPDAPENPDEPAAPKPKSPKRSKTKKPGKFLGVSKEEVNVAGTDYNLPAGKEVRTVTVTKGAATIDGDVRHEVSVINGDLTIGGHIGGDVVVVGGQLRLLPTAKLDGDAVVIGGNLERDEGAQIGGEVFELGFKLGPKVFDQLSELFHHGNVPGWIESWAKHCLSLGRLLSFDTGWTLVVNVAFLLLYLLLAWLFPSAVQASRRALETRPLSTVVLGIAGLPMIFCGVLLLTITLVGLVAVPFLLAASVFASYIGKTALLMTFGLAVVRPFRPGTKTQMVAALVVGWVVVSALYLIPFFGAIVWLSLALWGLGVALTALMRPRNLASKPLTSPPSPPPVNSDRSPTKTSPTPPPSSLPLTVLPVTALALTSGTPGEPTKSSFTGSESPSQAPAPGACTEGPTSPEGGPKEPTPSPKQPSAATTAPTAPLKYPKFSARLGALAIDGVVALMLLQLPPTSNTLAQVVIVVLYQWGMLRWRSATLGGIIFHQKVVRIDGRPVDRAVAGVRAVASILSIFSLGLGWLWPQWDREKQTWHDKLAGTVVVQLDRPEPLL